VLVQWCVGAVVYDHHMARLTITLSDERHQQLKLRAAKSGKSIGEVIESDLQASERLARERITLILEAAWTHGDAARPAATEDEVMNFALELEREVNGRSRTERKNGSI
jgi:plasmid stability protein